MAISVVRKFTQDDAEKIRKAAEKFCARHGISFGEHLPAEDAIDFAIEDADPGRAARIRKLWRTVYCRALGMPNRYHVD